MHYINFTKCINVQNEVSSFIFGGVGEGTMGGIHSWEQVMCMHQRTLQ